ncbi:MAG: glycerol kinase GlpK [Pelagibacterales bacterium]|jgi:glycerol kinase|nr:glycerol kinase GlpK [Pelagibacterales bacterium]
MSKSPYILAIDQGTSSTRAALIDKKGVIVDQESIEFKQIYPANGWVEHDPLEIIQTVKSTIAIILKRNAIIQNDIVSCGITNQRETIVAWDKVSGKPLYNAIVWQDRRTQEICQKLVDKNYTNLIQEKTGLIIDPYFSASKIQWLLEHIKDQKNLIVGTIDTWIIWNLTNKAQHVTDITNASRTMLYNIVDETWDQELLDLFKVDKSFLPKVLSNIDDFGTIHPEHFGIEIPIGGVIGDQQSASVGQLCLKKGMIKATYGTGCFVLINTDDNKIKSENKLLSTIASKLDGKKQYAVEGSIFNAGTVVQWLRDEMELFNDVSEIESLIKSSKNDITFIPAFTGLGAPYWKSDTRGTIYGITRDTSKGDIVKAALKSICFQTKDLLESLKLDLGDQMEEDMTMRVDGGMSNNNWMMQFLADILNIKVERPANHETTVMGAAYLAGLRVGFFSSLSDIEDLWKSDRVFVPSMDADERQLMYANWKKTVNNLIGL